jgi:hypothetical protein
VLGDQYNYCTTKVSKGLPQEFVKISLHTRRGPVPHGIWPIGGDLWRSMSHGYAPEVVRSLIISSRTPNP